MKLIIVTYVPRLRPHLRNALEEALTIVAEAFPETKPVTTAYISQPSNDNYDH